MNKNTQKILTEYKNRKELYEKFTTSFAILLRNLLKKDYKYHLDYRVKDKKSLKRKIERKEARGRTYEKLEDVTDISGVRIIFYTQSDRSKFMRKMTKEFGSSVEMEKRTKLSGYRGIHAIVSLGEERLKLAEYAAFRELKCEVQLCLILEHAWAEVEHDILYKESWGFRKLNAEEYIYMKERMGRIMRNHIEKASDELERVVHKFKKLRRGNRAG